MPIPNPKQVGEILASNPARTHEQMFLGAVTYLPRKAAKAVGWVLGGVGHAGKGVAGYLGKHWSRTMIAGGLVTAAGAGAVYIGAKRHRKAAAMEEDMRRLEETGAQQQETGQALNTLQAMQQMQQPVMQVSQPVMQMAPTTLMPGADNRQYQGFMAAQQQQAYVS